MTAPSDLELLHGCIAGDRSAWHQFVKQFTRYVYYLIQLTDKRYNAQLTPEDIADQHNDVFIALMEDKCRRLRAFEGRNGCSVRSWIRIITIRNTLDALRKRRKLLSLDDEGAIQLEDDTPNPLELLMAQADSARRAQLGPLTAQLSKEDQLLLSMFYTQKLSPDEIAAALRIKKGALYTRKTRLIQRLQRLAKDAGLLDP